MIAALDHGDEGLAGRRSLATDMVEGKANRIVAVLEIDDGGFVCLSAPSGGGKTTLLNAIGGLDKPDSGEVYIGEQRIDNLSKGRLADLRLRQIGFVFQDPTLMPWATVSTVVCSNSRLNWTACEVRSSSSILKTNSLSSLRLTSKYTCAFFRPSS